MPDSNQTRTIRVGAIVWVLVSCSLLALSLLALASFTSAEAQSVPEYRMEETIQPQIKAEGTRRVNAPYAVSGQEAAILWFGRVTPTENSADARVLYQDDHLYVRVAMFDRRLWYDTFPSVDDLLNWDAVTLYLRQGGNVGDVLDENTYRFDGQLVWWEPRDNYQAAYRGNGEDWSEITSALPFTTTSGWRGTAPNNEQNDRGWALTFYIPFSSLGLDGPPSQGEIWGMALAVHDRDDATGMPIADQIWPETMTPSQPATWGQLAFGLPTYDVPTAVAGETVTFRHGLDGAVVVDADVGGSSTCGQPAWPEFFPTWGDFNYAGKSFANIQNLGDIGDWPCFSRYYVTFPLDALPANKIILSATLTLYQFGNAGEGWDPGPQPSLIQVLRIGEDWDENTITWNNAPLALENVSAAWAYPLDPVPDWPGVPRQWDVSLAVAQAYASGSPVRLALYEADWAYHSGKYFVTSDTDEWGQTARPTLEVQWGDPVGEVVKQATPLSGDYGDTITYTLSLWATGETLWLTDTLPTGTSTPTKVEVEGTSITPIYDVGQNQLTWSDSVATGERVTLRYRVTLTTQDTQLLMNRAELYGVSSGHHSTTSAIMANPRRTFLPLTSKKK